MKKAIDWSLLPAKPSDFVYLSTGELCGFYTLRVVRWVPLYDPLGVCIGYEPSDRYVRNLAIRGEDAEAKAEAYAAKFGLECHASADFELMEHNLYIRQNEIAVEFAMKRQRMEFGKLKGKSFADAVESDPRYMQWVADQGAELDVRESFQSRHLSPYKMTCIAVSRLVANGALEITQPVVEPESPSNWIGEQGEKVEFTGTVVFIKAFSTQHSYNSWNQIFIVKADNGDVVKFFTTSTTFDNVQKGHKITLTGTVKSHDLDEYRDGAKVTQLSRVKCTNNQSEDQE